MEGKKQTKKKRTAANLIQPQDGSINKRELSCSPGDHQDDSVHEKLSLCQMKK